MNNGAKAQGFVLRRIASPWDHDFGIEEGNVLQGIDDDNRLLLDLVVKPVIRSGWGRSVVARSSPSGKCRFSPDDLVQRATDRKRELEAWRASRQEAEKQRTERRLGSFSEQVCILARDIFAEYKSKISKERSCRIVSIDREPRDLLALAIEFHKLRLDIEDLHDRDALERCPHVALIQDHSVPAVYIGVKDTINAWRQRRVRSASDFGLFLKAKIAKLYESIVERI